MSSKFIIILLLLALVFAGGKLYLSTQGRNTNSTDAEAFLNNILTRSSIRAYEAKPVEKEKIEKLLRAGMAAPSAADKRPWHFVVVTDKQLLNGIAVASPYAKPAGQAPMAIVVCGDTDKTLPGEGTDYWIQDCSAASENILLEAHALGLGAVWTGFYPMKERCDALAKVLNLPDNLIPLNAIIIGYPKSTAKPKDKWDEENITYDKF